jgi:2-dehydro-3-deoxy-D-arabinonate dehydratase
VAWTADTSTALLHRRLDDLVEHLYRATDFPHGAILSTGTGIVPGLDLSLSEGDTVRIEIEGVGVLTNPVVRVPRQSSVDSGLA